MIVVRPDIKVSSTIALVLALTLLPVCGVAGLPEPEHADVPRIGYLQVSELGNQLKEDFRAGLRDLGYIEGQNIVIEWRNADGRPERLPELAAELVALRVRVLVSSSDPGTRAAKAATSTIPIVACCTADPVATGLVASLARPGGNLSGVAPGSPPDLDSKRLQLLKETVPTIRRVVVLYHEVAPQIEILRALQAAADALDVQILPVGVQTAGDVDVALTTALAHHPDALFVGSSNPLNLRRPTLVKFTLDQRLPNSFRGRAFVQDGALMSYEPTSGMRRTAAYVDRILKGANPGDLPMETPSTFEFAMNLTTAEQLQLRIPPLVAALVTEWIR